MEHTITGACIVQESVSSNAGASCAQYLQAGATDRSASSGSTLEGPPGMYRFGALVARLCLVWSVQAVEQGRVVFHGDGDARMVWLERFLAERQGALAFIGYFHTIVSLAISESNSHCVSHRILHKSCKKHPLCT
jgi:hypothetical protein